MSVYLTIQAHELFMQFSIFSGITDRRIFTVYPLFVPCHFWWIIYAIRPRRISWLVTLINKERYRCNYRVWTAAIAFDRPFGFFFFLVETPIIYYYTAVRYYSRKNPDEKNSTHKTHCDPILTRITYANPRNFLPLNYKQRNLFAVSFSRVNSCWSA